MKHRCILEKGGKRQNTGSGKVTTKLKTKTILKVQISPCGFHSIQSDSSVVGDLLLRSAPSCNPSTKHTQTHKYACAGHVCKHLHETLKVDQQQEAVAKKATNTGSELLYEREKYVQTS